MSLSRNVKLALLGLVVTLLALYFIAVQVNFELFREAWITARFIYVIPCLLFLLLGLVTRALRWQVLLNYELPLRRTFNIMNIAYLVNGVLPLRMGELARIYLTTQGRVTVPAMQTTGSVIVERLLDLLAIVVMTLLALAMGPVPEQLQIASGMAAIAAIIGFAILVMLSAQRMLLHRLLDFLLEHFTFLQRFAIKDWLDQFLNGLKPLTEWRTLLAATGWTVISWVLSVIAGYVLMFAFFEQGDLETTMLYIAAAAFAIALPAVPGNVGTYEASILLALTAMGYEQSGAALAFAVMVHAVNVFVHASTGVLGFMQEGISLTQLTRGVRQMRQSTEMG